MCFLFSCACLLLLLPKRYSRAWTLASSTIGFHSFLRIVRRPQFLMPIRPRSVSTGCSHHLLGFPIHLNLPTSSYKILFSCLFWHILSTYPNLPVLLILINLTISHLFELSTIRWTLFFNNPRQNWKVCLQCKIFDCLIYLLILLILTSRLFMLN